MELIIFVALYSNNNKKMLQPELKLRRDKIMPPSLLVMQI